ncbi:uncharacterized protein LOC102708251 [Oryza brachyantha]|uniref:Uncharacterized protein n=1 Tax=Oryza brachyantha TaxID=4533 RepID=J3MDQ5_ORYBR|nr:uncharacterized protein LOC102708251 [Oryza brachyantha]
MAASPVLPRSRVLARAISASLRRGLSGASPSTPLLAAPSLRRASSLHRLPSVCGGLLSVMPLHSAVASARLRSAISPESQSWGVVPQGNSMPL